MILSPGPLTHRSCVANAVFFSLSSRWVVDLRKHVGSSRSPYPLAFHRAPAPSRMAVFQEQRSVLLHSIPKSTDADIDPTNGETRVVLARAASIRHTNQATSPAQVQGGGSSRQAEGELEMKGTRTMWAGR